MRTDGAYYTRDSAVGDGESGSAEVAGVAESSRPGAKNLAERRAGTDAWRASQSAVAKKLFPVNIQEQTMAECDAM